MDIPYPLVLSKKERAHYITYFLDIFKKMEIIIPFGEALQQMLMYTKFLKELLTKKGKHINNESIMVEVSVGKDLIDLGASINLIPLYMYDRIRNLRVSSTKMNLQLADHSIIRLYGSVEDVLIKVHQLTFPEDFVIMDIKENLDIPLILGRPFMFTVKCVVNIGNVN
ncbi:uncharacterized protein [Glycine max]|uniref:uncharacterized protein n=1 Tax=Glycine max TaxID=3847 RepID=UPI0003DE7F9B|nr:uncharacterized protein LOC102661350 [Glycine max]|eukprot:XP_006598629.1 uncharacterized protein LOC102661350 [Glycine max]